MFSVRCLFFVVGCLGVSYFIVCWLLCFVCRLKCVVRGSWFVVVCCLMLLFVRSYLLFVVWCSVFVVRCLCFLFVVACCSL